MREEENIERRTKEEKKQAKCLDRRLVPISETTPITTLEHIRNLTLGN